MNKVKFPKFKDYKAQPVRYIQPKLDGHLTKIIIGERVTKNIIRDDLALFAFTKNDKDITTKLLAIDHIRGELDGLPNNSIIFAELHCPGVLATSVPTMLNAADERLQLTAFAAPLLNGLEILPAVSLPAIMSDLDAFGISVAQPRIVSPDRLHRCYALTSISQLDQKELLKEAITQKFEGWVLKAEHMKGWYKLKPVKTLDAFVIGVQQSFSSTHFGGLQSITVAVWDKNDKIHNLGNAGSGFELEYRKQFDTNEKRTTLVDKVCEVAYDSIAANGKLRFPRFVRWRDDKNAKKCTTEQFES